jgi:hypothetical protein
MQAGIGLYSDDLEDTAEPPRLVHVIGSQAQLSFQHLHQRLERQARRSDCHTQRRTYEVAKPGSDNQGIE